MTRRNTRNIVQFAALGLALILGGNRATTAATYPAEYDFTGGTAGAFDWNLGANWTDVTNASGDVPGSHGQLNPPTGGDQVFIGDTTANRTITSPAFYTQLYNFSWTQTPSSAGVNTLKLGGDMWIYTAYQAATNTSASRANQVFDTNGHTITGYLMQYNKLTIVNSNPGVGELTDIFGPGIYDCTVSSGVRVVTTGVLQGTYAYYGYPDTNWLPGSVLAVRASGSFYTYGNVNPYRLEIGEPGTAAQGSLAFYSFFGPQTVQQDVEIYEPTGAVGSPLNIGTGFGGMNFMVAGNFTDHGLATDPSYITGLATPHLSTLVFNGSPVTPRTVNIARNITDNSVDFRVGNSTSDKGNIVLGQDLTIAGDMHVVDGSKLDIATTTLTVGGFKQDATAGETAITLGITVGPQTGVVNVLGDLTLNDFTLDVSQLGDWAGLHTLVLFTYTGTLTGTPNITIGNVNTETGLFLYDSLVYGGGVVELTNAQIPEPASACLLAVAAACLLPRRRRD